MGFLDGFLGSMGSAMGGTDLSMDPSMDQRSPDYLQYQAAHNTQQDVPQSQFLGEMPGKRSWFQNLLSGAITGLAGGADAPDAATAFGRGYMAVMQQRQAEVQQARQQAAFEQQQYLWQAQRTKDNMDMMEKWQKMHYYPQEIQAKVREQDAALVNAMSQAGYRPKLTAPATPEGASSALQQTDGKAMTYDLMQPGDGNLYGFELDPNQQEVTPTDITFTNPISGDSYTVQAGEPWQNVRDARKNWLDSIDTKFKEQQDTTRTQMNNQATLGAAGIYAGATKYSADQRALNSTGANAPGNLTETQQKQYQFFQGELGNVRKQAASFASQLMQRPTLRTEITKAADGTYTTLPNASPEAQQLVKQINALKLQESQYLQQLQGLIGTSQPQAQTGGPYDPFASNR